MQNNNLKESLARLVYARYLMEKNFILKKNFKKIKEKIFENDQKKISEIRKKI